MSRDETVNLSYNSDVESYHEHLSESIEDERAIRLISTHDDESCMKSVTETDSCGILRQSAREQSLDLATVKDAKENQYFSVSQVHTSSALKSGFATSEQSTTFTARHMEEDVTEFATSLEVSTSTTETSLTTAVDRSHEADRFVMK